MTDVKSIADGLSEAAKSAVLAARVTPLGNVLPASDQDAVVLHEAGLAWSPAHWWHPLNRTGLSVRAHLLSEEPSA